MDWDQALGRLLWTRRDMARLSRKQLSERLQGRTQADGAFSEASLRRIEHGSRSPTLTELRVICEVIEVDTLDLLNEWWAVTRPEGSTDAGLRSRPALTRSLADGGPSRRELVRQVRELWQSLRDEHGDLPPLHLHLPETIFRDEDGE